MSEYDFDGGMAYSGGNPGDGQDPGYGAGQPGRGEQSPKWFREYMDKANEQIKLLNTRLEAAEAEKRSSEIRTAFESKGYAPEAAALYTGDTAQLDSWLEAHGSALARTGQQAPPVPGEMPAPQAQQSGVPLDVQQNLARMQQMGQQFAAGPNDSSDDKLAAALKATNSPEEFLQVAQAHGWQYDATNMGMQ